MKCPYCGSPETGVVDKRDNTIEGITRRRRECLKCYKRFTTYERVEHIELDVVKRDGSTEQFDRVKLYRGIKKSINKRPITDEQVYGIIDDIELKLLNRQSKEVRSSDIGRMVLNRLRHLDPVAYMRFASVYRDFDSLEDFAEELNLLRHGNE